MSDDFFESLKQTIAETASVVGKRTEDMMEIQKLRSRIRTAQKNIDLEYGRIGAIIYQRFVEGEQLDCELANICDAIAEYRTLIELSKEELAEKKGQNICPKCGNTNPKDATFCMHCGEKMPKEDVEDDIFEDETVKAETPEEEADKVWEACAPDECESEACEPEEDQAE